jgi:FAD/FMN-containing dehydrogenase
MTEAPPGRGFRGAAPVAINLRPGAVGWSTDVCVPISRLPECIAETKRDLETATIPATILGHVGNGNPNVIFSLDRTHRTNSKDLFNPG